DPTTETCIATRTVAPLAVKMSAIPGHPVAALTGTQRVVPTKLQIELNSCGRFGIDYDPVSIQSWLSSSLCGGSNWTLLSTSARRDNNGNGYVQRICSREMIG